MAESASNVSSHGPERAYHQAKPVVADVRLPLTIRRSIEMFATAAPFESAVELVRACRLAGPPDAVVIDADDDPDGVVVLRSDAVTSAVPIVAITHSEDGARLAVEAGADFTCTADLRSLREAVARATGTRHERRIADLDSWAAMAERVAAVTHEIRSPITALRGYVDLLLFHWRELPDETRDEVLLTLQRVSTRLWHRVEDLLAVATLDAAGLRMQPRVVDVVGVIDRALELALPDPTAVSVTCQEGLEAIAVADRVEQILANLLANAMRHGTPPVSVDARALDRTARIEVRDEGDGIAHVPDDRLFSKWSPLAGGVPDSHGLGLYVSRALAGAMGGSLTFEPHDNKSAFVLSLPLASH